MNDREQHYEDIETLVSMFQNGDSESGAELIANFKPYLSKYIKILHDGLLDLGDIDSRKFVSLFITDKDVRRSLIKAYQPTSVRNEAYKVVALLNRLCEVISRDDIEQELSLVLLILTKRYQKKGRKKNFCGYVYNSFRYELYRHLCVMVKDPLTYRAGENISYYDQFNLTPNDEEKVINEIKTEDTLYKLLEDELDNSWVRGLTCSDIFGKLTPFQRLVLKLHYQEGLSDPKIADKLGMHVNTIFRQRTKAIGIVGQASEDHNENNNL